VFSYYTKVIKSDPIDSDPEEKVIEEWSPEQLRKRSRELKLIDANGNCQLMKTDLSAKATPEKKLEDGLSSEVEEESKSPSRSTTSDSQVCTKVWSTINEE
jgi:hypothetical protein